MYIQEIPQPFLLIFTADPNIPRLLYYLHVPSMIVALLMGIVIYFRSGKTYVSKILMYQFIIFSIWSFFDLLSWANNDTDKVMFAWNLFYPMGTLTNLMGLIFLRVYGGNEKLSLKEKTLFNLVFFLLIYYCISGKGLPNFDMLSLGATENIYYTLTYYIFNLSLSIYILIYAITGYYRKNQNRQITIMGIGLFAYIFLSQSFSAVASFFVITGNSVDYAIEPYGLIGMPIYLGTIAYCMTKYKAFNIELKETRILILSIIIFIAAEISFMEEMEERWFVGITLLVCAILGYFLFKTIKSEEEKKLLELEKVNQTLKEKNLQVERANKELQKLDSAKSEFINIASHQLRSPLTIIKGVASLLVSRKIDKFSDTDKEQFYNSVWSKCLKLENIIDDILNAATFTNKKFSAMNKAAENVKVEELIHKILDDLSYEIAQRELEVKLIDQRIIKKPILGQKEYLEEAFVNLITNAIKYTPSTRRTDDVRETRSEKGRITIILQANENSKTVKITFQDNGIGIPLDEISYLFDRFYRAENARRMYTDGTGLGLFIVKEIIEGHGGRIEIESQVNKGTAFIVTLPFIPSERPDIREYIIEQSEKIIS